MIRTWAVSTCTQSCAYAYDRLAARDRATAHTRLRDYFAAVPQPDRVTRLEELAPVIELYHHTIRAGKFEEAFTLFHDRLWSPLYFQLGAYQLMIDLLRAFFPDGEDRPRRLKMYDQSAALVALANAYSLSGHPRLAIRLLEQQIGNDEWHGKEGRLYVALGLGNMANNQMAIGALQAAETSLRRSVVQFRETKNESHARLATRDWDFCWPIAVRIPKRKRNWRRR